MSTMDQVYQTLYEAGRKLKDDLWTEQDTEVLRQRAKDLVGLQLKVQQATDPQKKGEYQLAASLVVNHVTMLALTRMHIGQQHVVEAFQKLLSQALSPELGKILKGLFKESE